MIKNKICQLDKGYLKKNRYNTRQSGFNDHGVTVLDWPANSPDLNPIENLDERHQTQQCR